MGKGKRIALLIDVDNVKISKDAVEELLGKLNNYGEVVYCKFYGYNDRKHLYLSDIITNYGYETAPFMRLKKRYSQLDNRIIVDAVSMNYTKPDIDTFCIVAGDGDLIPLLVELKSCGKTVIDVNTEYQELNTHMFDEHINLVTINSEAQTYTPKTKKAKTTVKKQKAAAAQEGLLPVDLVLIDGNKIPPQFIERALNCEYVIKGDARVNEIAAASILAKTTRDADLLALDQLYPDYGFAKHKGYPTPAHLKILQDKEILPCYRKSFGPVRELVRQRTGQDPLPLYDGSTYYTRKVKAAHKQQEAEAEAGVMQGSLFAGLDDF